VVLGCSGISWTICKQSAARFRQITAPTPNHSIFYRPDALLNAQPTVSKHSTQQLNRESRTHVYKSASLLSTIINEQYHFMSSSDRFLVPVRSAVKSNFYYLVLLKLISACFYCINSASVTTELGNNGITNGSLGRRSDRPVFGGVLVEVQYHLTEGVDTGFQSVNSRIYSARRKANDRATHWRD